MSKDIQMGLRLKPEFHKLCSESAEFAGQSLAEWIRRAMKDKLDREQVSRIGESTPPYKTQVHEFKEDVVPEEVEYLKSQVDDLSQDVKELRGMIISILQSRQDE